MAVPSTNRIPGKGPEVSAAHAMRPSKSEWPTIGPRGDTSTDEPSSPAPLPLSSGSVLRGRLRSLLLALVEGADDIGTRPSADRFPRREPGRESGGLV